MVRDIENASAHSRKHDSFGVLLGQCLRRWLSNKPALVAYIYRVAGFDCMCENG